MTIRKIMTTATIALTLILTGCHKNYEWLDREPMINACNQGGARELNLLFSLGFKPIPEDDYSENAYLRADNKFEARDLTTASRMGQLEIMRAIGTQYTFVALTGDYRLADPVYLDRINNHCKAFVDRYNSLSEDQLDRTRLYNIMKD